MAESVHAGASRTLLDRIEQAALLLAALSLGGVVACQAWQVFSRYVLNAAPSWTDPAALLLIANAAMLGAAVVTRREAHFAFAGLVSAAPPPLARALRCFSDATLIALGLALLWIGGTLAAGDLHVAMAGVPLPVGMRYLPMCMGGALIALFAGERLALRLRGDA
ncbi:MAG: TRAP transporter small permease subunit [Hyphomonadaceae bacterium]|nr:TRAP transporter small permease subunit [Hyphomonadaceae bacterium]